jgi:tetratricopeptide (TPR) repeat protein
MQKVIKSILVLTTGAVLTATGFLVYQNYTSANTLLEVSTKRRVNLGSYTPGNPAYSSLISEAKLLYDNRDYNQSIKKYVEAYEIDRNSNQALIGIAEVYIELDRLDLAEQNLINAQKIEPLNTAGQVAALKISIINENLDQAKKIYDSILESSNKKLILGVVLDILNNNIDLAIQKNQEIIKLNQADKFLTLAQSFQKNFEVYKTFIDSPKAYLNSLIAKSLIDQNEFLVARPLLFASIQEKNDFRDAWIMLGYTYLLGNKNADATKALERAKNIDPYNPETYFYLGLAQKKNNQEDVAVENFKKASSFGFRNNKDSLIQIAHSLFLQEEYSEASKYFMEALSTGQLSIDDYTRITWINLEVAPNLDNATLASSEALKFYPETAIANNLMGWAKIYSQSFGEAETYLNLALKLDPNLDAAYLNLGLLKTKQSDLVAARGFYEQAITKATENNSSSIAERARSELLKITTPSS